MSKLNDFQARILKVLANDGGWLTRNKMKVLIDRKKGYSEALGASTTGEVADDSLLGRQYVKLRDENQRKNLEYRITLSGQQALAKYENEKGEVQLNSDGSKFSQEVTETEDLHEPSNPKMERLPVITEEGLETQEDFDPAGIKDERERVYSEIVQRQGQPEFRENMLKAYDGCCAITACSVKFVLEAAHIIPYQGEATNHPQNGILLRADFHTLFDLHLIAIDEDTEKLLVSSDLNGTEYEKYRGKKVRIPEETSRGALKQHRENCSNLS